MSATTTTVVEPVVVAPAPEAPSLVLRAALNVGSTFDRPSDIMAGWDLSNDPDIKAHYKAQSEAKIAAAKLWVLSQK